MESSGQADDESKDFSSEDEESWLDELSDGWGVEFQEQIPGFVMLRGLIPREQQEDILSILDVDSTFQRAGCNQAMWFGHLPQWTRTIVDAVPVDVFPPEIRRRQPLFNQMIVNLYHPGQGLKDHIDLLRFKDGICILSLGSTAVMDFSKGDARIGILLRPGDLVALHGDARYRWSHGIPAVDVDTWDGIALPRGRRVSLTLRSIDAE